MPSRFLDDDSIPKLAQSWGLRFSEVLSNHNDTCKALIRLQSATTALINAVPNEDKADTQSDAQSRVMAKDSELIDLDYQILEQWGNQTNQSTELMIAKLIRKHTQQTGQSDLTVTNSLLTLLSLL